MHTQQAFTDSDKNIRNFISIVEENDQYRLCFHTEIAKQEKNCCRMKLLEMTKEGRWEKFILEHTEDSSLNEEICLPLFNGVSKMFFSCTTYSHVRRVI